MRNIIVSALHDLELKTRPSGLADLIHRLKFSPWIMGGEYATLGAFYARESQPE